MGGCATKPKVSRDNAPEPAKEDTPKAVTDNVLNLESKAQDYTEKYKVDEFVHDDKTDAAEDQANRRRSLSSLFQDSQIVGKDLAEDKKTEKKELTEGEEKPTGENGSNEYKTTEETVQQETPETEKPADQSQISESEKQESTVNKHEPSVESQSNEPVKQEPLEADHQEKPSEESESKETLKQEPTEAEKPTEDSETAEETTTADDEVPEKLVEVVSEAAGIKKMSEKLTDEESGAVTVIASVEDKNKTLDSLVDQDEASEVEVKQ